MFFGGERPYGDQGLPHLCLVVSCVLLLLVMYMFPYISGRCLLMLIGICFVTSVTVIACARLGEGHRRRG